MTTVPVKIGELHQAREDMLVKIKSLLTDSDKKFLQSFKQVNPDWASFAYPKAQEMPAVKWKLHNLQQMNEKARQLASERLAAALNN